MDSASQKITPIIFKGKTTEYFGIWIVNLLLTIVTLGIYSAWAKVRRKKYFYHNTLIDDVGFDYHAKPISILKGRMIAFAFFMGYSFSAKINPLLPAIFMLVLFVFLPWLVVRGSIFNARNSSHRGLRFDFVGTVGQAAKVFIALPLLTFFTLGLIIPYISHEKSQFLVNNHRFGLSQFEMSRVVKQFYKVYLFLIAIPLVLFIVGVIVGGVMRGQELIKAKPTNQSELLSPANINAFVPINQQKMLLALNEFETEVLPEDEAKLPDNQIVERVYSESNPPSVDKQTAVTQSTEMQPEQFQGEVQENLSEQDLKKIQEQMSLEDNSKKQNPLEFMKDWLNAPFAWLLGLAALVLYGFFIFGFVAYLQARIGNLIWNNTKLEQLSFQSKLRARDFIWLYFSNIVAIMLTFGLATPWAQIRLARYRASKLSIVGDVDFDQFVGDKKAEVKATGEEIAEMFDVDLSFG